MQALLSHSRSFLLSGVAAVALVACSSPTTLPPKATQQEILAEQKNQMNPTQKINFPKIDGPVQRTPEMQKRIDAIAARIEPQTEQLCKELYAGKNVQCRYELELEESSENVNAYANGTKVVVTPAMMKFAEDDNQLAFVLSHEMAHNVMSHPQRAGQNAAVGGLLGSIIDIAAASAGGSTGGAFGQIGAQGAILQYSPEFEHEADYIGLYILSRANYDITRAPEFWRAMSQYSPEGAYRRSTHPSNPERYVTMKKTVNEINSKKKLGMPLLPEFKPAE